MRYFQFNVNEDEKNYEKIIIFGIDFEVENGERIWVEELFERHLNGHPMALLRILKMNKRKRLLPEIGYTDTSALIVRKDCFDALETKFLGLTTIPVMAERFEVIYYVLWFNECVDCVDWDHSEYYPWPEGTVLRPWHNPRANWFIRPALDKTKLPENLDVFRLKEWGGPFNFFVNEKVAEKISTINNAEKFVDFRELDCY
ncbi:MAG: hypothetical protein LBC37_01250 [Zoogloeaceae bacterium]|jgi:hypothetical protein|nr:hypothetical protein [Zoogloeaceae bacterium]